MPAIRANSTGTITGGNKYLTLPTDWLSTFSLAVVDGAGSYTYLLDKDVNFIRESYPDPNTLGVPKYSAVFDENTLLIGPTPDINYTVELHYFRYPESIVTATTTWLGDNFSSALLYGALLEAYIFMKGEADIIAAYQTQFDKALASLKQLTDGKDRRDTYRSGQVRDPVQ